ncbi:SPOR domain-containing protein [Flexithrix dorotheae]|uniref:SPOR domain-containing protein n=1 Tax=Flexithrix dorotheae TaxID=70993 RepID=UPI00037C82E1|nr:SPOR domain-containing protein [Flexithrix dorotheae]
MSKYTYLFFLAGLFLIGCKGSQVANTSGPFKDDISLYKVKIESEPSGIAGVDSVEENGQDSGIITNVVPQPKTSINYQLDQQSILIAQKNLEDLTDHGTKGFRILVYSGGSRDRAEEIEKDLILYEKTYQIFDVPNYKVKVGDYFTKLEANGALVQIKKEYPQAIIIPDIIEVNLDDYILGKNGAEKK